MHRADCWCEVAVARNDDCDVELWRKAHKVDDEFDVEVRLEATVAVLANILADNLVVVAREEVVEGLLVLVVWIKTGVGVGANKIAVCRKGLKERDVIDVNACSLCCVEDVCDVYENSDITCHYFVPLVS